MKRREFLVIAASMAILPASVRAQQPPMPVVGLLGPQPTSTPFGDAVLAGLRDLGYVEGFNMQVESRWADGKFEELRGLAADLVRLNVNVLVTSLTQATLVAKNTTATIPIVMAGVGDPVAAGLIASLAHPGGNITGTASLTVDIVGKQLELLKELAPGVARVAVLWNPANTSFQRLQLIQFEGAAKTTGLSIQMIEASSSKDFEQAFNRIAIEQTRALAVLGDPLFTAHAEAIAKLALKSRVVTVSNSRAMGSAGVPLTYGPNILNLHKRAAVYVDKILKGTMPSNLPVEQPTTFELIVNVKAAKALGVTVPSTLLARADEVIE